MKEEDVIALKKELFKKTNRLSIKDLAEKYGISKMHVTRIARGDSWKKVLPKLVREKQTLSKIPPATVDKIKIALKKKNPYQKAIADKFKVSEVFVSRIKKQLIESGEL